MAEWLYEAGIGEARAALVDGDAIVEAHIETDEPALRMGQTLMVRLVEKQANNTRGIVRSVVGNHEALLDRLTDIDIGRAFAVTVTREAITEPGAVKRAKVRPAPDTAPELAESPGFTLPGSTLPGSTLPGSTLPGSTLYDRIAETGLPITTLTAHGPDLLEDAGWSETLEHARSGEVRFTGGAMRISLTPAMTLIDIDGELAPGALALAGAKAAGSAIRRFGITGSIGIDFPTVRGKVERLAIADLIDAAIPQPFERTAVNGFGFLQIVRPRFRASLCEQLQFDAVAAEGRALIRRAMRSGLIGAIQLVAHRKITTMLLDHPKWLSAVSAHVGGPVTLRPDAALAMSAGYATKNL